MTKVPLIPFTRPIPQIMRKGPPALARKGDTVAKKTALLAQNTEDITKKAVGVQRLWQLLSKMDPEGTLWVSNAGLILLAGEGPQARSPKALKLNDEEVKLVTSVGIFDADAPDDQATAKAVIASVYQLVELAFDMGMKAETERRAAADAPDEEEQFDAEADVNTDDPIVDPLDDEDDEDDDDDDDA